MCVCVCACVRFWVWELACNVVLSKFVICRIGCIYTVLANPNYVLRFCTRNLKQSQPSFNYLALLLSSNAYEFD